MKTGPEGRRGSRVHRAVATAALLLLVLTTTASSVSARSMSWVDGFVAELGDAGQFRLTYGERTPLSLRLLWFDAESSSGVELVPGRGLEGRDDESATRLRGRPATFAARWIHWDYFHVDPVLFLDARLTPDEGALLDGTIGLAIEPESSWTRRSVTLRPHVAVGRSRSAEVEIFETVVDLDDTERRHVGVVRLDRQRSVITDDGASVLWEAGTDTSWPLAVIVAPSRSSLEYFVGQALVTYDQVGAADTPRWKIPPMCGRCRSPRLEELRLEASLRDGSLRMLADLRSDQALHPVAWAALRLEDVSMDLYHRGRIDGRALYEIPVTAPAALTIAEAIEDGSLDAEVVMDAGTRHRPDGVFVMAAPRLAERVRALVPADLNEELPSYLSPRLVENRPNPFRDGTVIEVEVPDSIHEAFDLEPSLLARIDPSTPPPFGLDPMVRVKVYNVSGQLVDVLDERPRTAGRFSVRWDGTDVQGRPVAAGAYYVNVEIGEWSVTKRVLRIRN